MATCELNGVVVDEKVASADGGADREVGAENVECEGAECEGAECEGAERMDSERKTSGRDAAGRFLRGNSGGPGNPFGRQMAMFRASLMASVTQEDFDEVAATLIARAKCGNMQAIKLFLSYTVGKPMAAVNPDQVDVDEWEVFKQEADMSKDVERVVKTMEPEVVLTMARKVKPVLQREMLRKAVAERGWDEIAEKAKGEETPSTNGETNGSANDGKRDGAPSTDGESRGEVRGDVPSGNGEKREEGPSTDGGERCEVPSTDGESGDGVM